MELQPLGENIIVKSNTQKEESISKAGIIIPKATWNQLPDIGEVIAISGELSSIAQIRIGDKVLFRKYSTTEIKIEDQEYLVMAYEDIIAKIN